MTKIAYLLEMLGNNKAVIKNILEQINLAATNCPRGSLLPHVNPTHTNTSLSLNPI
jgi:hypothetical protein